MASSVEKPDSNLIINLYLQWTTLVSTKLNCDSGQKQHQTHDRLMWSIAVLEMVDGSPSFSLNKLFMLINFSR